MKGFSRWKRPFYCTFGMFDTVSIKAHHGAASVAPRTSRKPKVKKKLFGLLKY